MLKRFGLKWLLLGTFVLGALSGASLLYFNTRNDKSFYDRLYSGERYVCSVNSEHTAEEILKSIRMVESAWEKHYANYKQDFFGNLFPQD